jgi:phosphoribosyl-ATP pyrophosphohydrolase/phosphoribosyl-AMP cyclohydrolase
VTKDEKTEPKWNEQGLVPAIVQDARTGEVLMLAWMNAEAWRRTLDTGEAHFWSRSRQSLWHKGETSGHVQRVVEARLDCDADTVLLRVDPAGPACHTGERSCFYTTIGEKSESGERVSDRAGNVLEELYRVIQDRQKNPPPGSYTAKLLAEGLGRAAQKVGEEAVEVVVAALSQSDERLVSECADLAYHALVLLAARGVPLSRVEKELAARRK